MMGLKFIDSLPLRVKLAMLPLILLGSLTLVVSKIATGIQVQREEATLINAAGRQRMLNQRYVKEVMYAGASPDTSASSSYQKTRQLFMGSLEVLMNGGELVVNPGDGSTKTIKAARDPQLIETLQRNRQLAIELETLAMNYLKAPQAEKSVNIAELLALNARLHKEANHAVQLFVKQSNDAIDSLIWRCIYISLMAAVFALAISYVISGSIARPIDLFSRRLKLAAQGDLTQSEILSRKDEFGRMSSDLNNTLTAVRQALGSSQVDWNEVATLFSDMKSDLHNVRAIVTQVPTAMILLNGQGIVNYMNPQAQANVQTLAGSGALPCGFQVLDNITLPQFGCGHLWQLCTATDQLPYNGIAELGNERLDLSIQALLDDCGNVSGTLMSWQIVTDDVKRQETMLANQSDAEKKANALACLIDELGSAVQAAAKGDFSKSITMSEDEKINSIASSVNEFMQHTHHDMSNIKQRSLALLNAASQLSASTDTLDKTAHEAHTKTHSILGVADSVNSYMGTAYAATEQMSASIISICDSTKNAEKVTREAVTLSDGAAVTVGNLFKSSSDIGNVLKFITSIAEQTNLLALNATIEAARAGDAGKGFAVVANEVKELAKQTANATNEIGASINNIQTDSTRAVQSINQINDIVDKISEFQTIIAAAISEQTAVSRELSQTIGNTVDSSSNIRSLIDELTLQNKVGGEVLTESRIAIAEVTESAQQLELVMAHYQLGDAKVLSKGV